MNVHPAAGDVDRAALLGAALAAIVALTFGGAGEWDWLATCAGVALLAVLSAFFRLPPGDRPRRAVIAEVAAMAAVVALAAALVVATPMQALLSAHTAAGERCRAAGAVAASVVLESPEQQRAAVRAAAALPRGTSTADALADAAADAGRKVRGDCDGALTSRLLWLPALVVGIGVFGTARIRMRRTSR